jgi:hypothetical protein
MREAQKASWTETRLAMPRITTVVPAGISSMFIQDLPPAIKSPINMPQKTQGMTNATTKVALIF